MCFVVVEHFNHVHEPRTKSCPSCTDLIAQVGM
jgi:hypothetical protein